MAVSELEVVSAASQTVQSEVGNIPLDWSVQKLGDICSIRAGGDVDWERFSPVENSDYPYPVWANARSSVPYGYSSRSEFPGGSLTVTARGDIGHATFRRRPYCAVGRLLSLVPSQGVSGYYLAEYINARVRFATESTGVPQLTGPQIGGYKVAVPRDRNEGQVIAEALYDADCLIESLSQLLVKKRQIRQGAMQELLTGKRRLPGFVDSWKSATIGSFAECVAGGTPSTNTESYWGGDIPWMSSGELHLKQVKDVEGRITDEGLRNSSAKWIPPGCVLLGLAGQGKTRGTVAMNHVPLCTNQSIAAILPVESCNSLFLYFNLESRYEELRELSAGDGGRGGLNLTLIRNLIVPMPCLAEQAEIAAVLADIDSDIASFEERLAKARNIKLGMMQALLTGRIRLVQPASSVIPVPAKAASTAP